MGHLLGLEITKNAKTLKESLLKKNFLEVSIKMSGLLHS